MGRMNANRDQAGEKIKDYTEKKKEQIAVIGKIEKAKKNATQAIQ